jgi:hypothetical protein
MAHETFQVGDLTAVIGDNESYEGHRAGYNGVHRLTHRTNPKSLFTVTGLNHEHIFDGEKDVRGDNKVFFQPETPTFHLETWTRFKLVAPHYIDFSFRLQAPPACVHERLYRPFLGNLHRRSGEQVHLLSRRQRLGAVLHPDPQ